MNRSMLRCAALFLRRSSQKGGRVGGLVKNNGQEKLHTCVHAVPTLTRHGPGESKSEVGIGVQTQENDDKLNRQSER